MEKFTLSQTLDKTVSVSENLKRQKTNILGFTNDVSVQNRQINYTNAIFCQSCFMYFSQNKNALGPLCLWQCFVFHTNIAKHG